jgi:hypothetical protein
MNEQEKQKKLLDTLEAMFASLPKGTVTVVPITDATQEKFFFTLVGMAQWAVAHPSESRFEYLSPDDVKASKTLTNAFMNWWVEDHPYLTDAQETLFQNSISRGLSPSCVIEHTADGHHPFGWSWGSEWYIADFYMCLTYALIQRGIKMGKDVKDKFAPIYIAKQVEQLNRVTPTVEIIDAMDERLNEPEPNVTRPYGVVSAEVN